MAVKPLVLSIRGGVFTAHRPDYTRRPVHFLFFFAQVNYISMPYTASMEPFGVNYFQLWLVEHQHASQCASSSGNRFQDFTIQHDSIIVTVLNAGLVVLQG